MVHDYFRHYLINHPETKLSKKKKSKKIETEHIHRIATLDNSSHYKSISRQRSRAPSFATSAIGIISKATFNRPRNLLSVPTKLIAIFEGNFERGRERGGGGGLIGRGVVLERDRSKFEEIDSINTRFVETEKFGFATGAAWWSFKKLDRVVRDG